MLAEQTGEPPLDALVPVASRDGAHRGDRRRRATIFVEESVNRYVVALLRHTRENRHLALGASPRSGIALLRLAKARALVERRDVRDAGRHPRDGGAGALPSAPARARGPLGRARRRATSSARHSRGRPYRCETAELRGHRSGVAALVASWAFGSTPLVVVGLGFARRRRLRAPLGARRAWLDRVRAAAAAGERIEGDDLVVEIRGQAPPAPRSAARSAPPAARRRSSRRRGCRRPHGRSCSRGFHRGRHGSSPRRRRSPTRSASSASNSRSTCRSTSSIRPRIPTLDVRSSRRTARAMPARRGRAFRRPDRASRSTPFATTCPANRCARSTGRAPRGAAV